MKTLRTTFTVLFAFVATFLFQSCFTDDDADVADYIAVATTHVVPADNGVQGTYYFELDNAKTLTPVINNANSFSAVEGQRVILQYDIESSATAGYDYGIELFKITEILTKNIEILTADNEDEIGNDVVTISQDYSNMTSDHLNLQISYPAGSSSASIHLVENTITPAEDSDYTVLELRLNNPNSDSETSTQTLSGLVSFNMGDYNPTITGKLGLKVIAKITNEGELKEYTFTFESTQE